MRTAKRITATIIVAVLAISMIAVLASCDGKFDIKWENYLLTSETYIQKIHGNFPELTEVELPFNAREVDLTYAGYGLVTYQTSSTSNNNTIGYLYAKGNTIGDDLRLSQLTAQSISVDNGDDLIVYIGRTSDKTYLFDIEGNSIANYNGTVEFGEITVKKGVKYVSATINDTETDTVNFVINQDGTLSETSETLGGTLPEEGGTFDMSTTSLSSFLPVTSLLTDNSSDKYLDYEVRTYNPYMYGFYNEDGKEVSVLTLPTEANMLTYLDGKIIYSVNTHVDAYAAKGYNFISDGEKYLHKLYSFTIRSGKVAEIKTNYVIDSIDYVLYNNENNAYDIALATVYPMENGVARSDSAEDSVIINSNGSVGFNLRESKYGMPILKIGDNYLTTGAYIVDDAYKLVAYLGDCEPSAILNDTLLLKSGNKVGVVDFDGVVTRAFEEMRVIATSGNYVVVTKTSDDGETITCVLDLTNNEIKTLNSVTGVISNSTTLTLTGSNLLIKATPSNYGQSTYYMLDGTKLGSGDELTVSDAFVRGGSAYMAICLRSSSSYDLYYFTF